MPELSLDPEELRRRLAAYTPESEQAIRDRQASLGEDATRPAVNAFFRKALEGRRFARAADLGCNNGAFALEVLAPVSDSLLLADFSEKALEAAGRRLPGAHAVRLDLTKAPPPGRFDLASLCEVIQHIPDPGAREAAFARAAAALEPGGILLYSGYFERPGEPLDGLFRSDRWPELLFFHRSPEAENAARFAASGLEILGRFREEKVEAFVLRKP